MWVALFGLQVAATRYVAMLQTSDEAQSWKAARAILILSFVFGAVVMMAYIALSPVLSFYFTKSYSSTYVFVLGGVYLFAYAISAIMQGIVQGLKKYALLAKILLVSRFVMVGVGVATLLIYPDVYAAVGAWIVYFVITIAWSLKIILPLMSKHHGRYSYSEILKYSFPLAIAGILSVVATSSDLVVVGGYLNQTQLGVINAAVTISAILSVVLVTPLITTLLPEVSASSRDPVAVSNGMRLALRFVMLALLPASLLFAAMPNQFLTLFSSNSGYLAGAESMQLIAAFYLFVGIQSMVFSMLQAVGKTIEAMVLGIVTSATDIAFAVLLVPQFGILGDAMSRDAVAVIGAIVSLYLGRQYIRQHDGATFYLKALTAAAIPAVLVYSLTTLVSQHLVTLVPYALVGTITYIACLKGLKLISEQDKEFISHILPRPLHRILRWL